MTILLICEWCGFSNEMEIVEEGYNYYECPSCGVYEVDFTGN